MLFNLFFIIGIELVALAAFCAGFIFGRYSCKKGEGKTIIDKITLDDDTLDPVSPEDQMLIQKLEEEVKRNVHTEEED